MKTSTLGFLMITTVVLCASIAAVSGAYRLDAQQVVDLIAGRDGVPMQDKIVFWQIRLPRILAALLLGAALAGAGTTYQGMFRNPLVSPDILGVAAGAGLGACTAILLGLPILFIQLYAFTGGLLVVAGVWLITRRVKRHDPVLTLVLVGIALGTVCGAGISLIKTLADPYTQLPSITFWLLGGLSTITLHDLWFSAPLILAGLVPLLLLRWRMNLLTLSDDEARSLGINVSRLRLGLIVCATLVTACTVAIAGIIAMRPSCIVLDEPTAMLDPKGRMEVMKTIRMLNRSYGITIVLITHYMEEAAQADRVIVMDDGNILLDDRPEEVFSHVEQMKAIGLDVPQVTELVYELRQQGIPLDSHIISEDAGVEAILQNMA